MDAGAAGRLTVTGLLALLLGLVMAPTSVRAATLGVPDGYGVVASESLGLGVDHVVLRRDSPAEEVHVARLAPGSGARLQTVLASDSLAPTAGLETTSSMCARVRCLAAINGDFTDTDLQPVGAMVSEGELVRSPGIPHTYLKVAGTQAPSVSFDFDWRVEIAAGSKAVLIATVNRPQDDALALYTARWGPSTRTAPATTEAIFEFTTPSASPLPVGETALRLVGVSAGGNSPIGANQVVVAGRGPAAQAVTGLGQAASGNLLTALLGSPTAGMRVSTGGADNVIGGSPQLLSGGAIAFPADEDDSFTRNRHPRTIAGITASGEVLLVSVDGRQPGHSHGLSLIEAAELLSGLGAVEAINLDGGGSTTFATGGQVRNQPSDSDGERPVSSALVIVASGRGTDAPPATRTAALATPPPPVIDPASRPPNLVGDLLPPLERALRPVVEPANDVVAAAAERLVSGLRHALQNTQRG